MITTVTIDKAGRVIIPKTLRDELRLEAGDNLILHSRGESFTFHPLRKDRMIKKGKFWVFKGGGKLALETVNKTIQKMRDEREHRIMFPEG